MKYLPLLFLIITSCYDIPQCPDCPKCPDPCPDISLTDTVIYHKDSLVKEIHHYKTIFDTLLLSQLLYPNKPRPHIFVNCVNHIGNFVEFKVINYDLPHEIIVQMIANVVINDSLHENHYWDTIQMNHAETFQGKFDLQLDSASLYDLIVSVRYNGKIIDMMDLIHTSN